MTTSASIAGRASVVIPAHNAAATIDACLASIDTDGCDIIVVCNGCTDATASIARARGHGIRVVEVPEANKAAALNLGDRHAHGFPRLYVDADVVFEPGAFEALVDTLEHGTLAASPHATVTTTGCSTAVRSYYTIWDRLGSATSGLWGAGVYGLSAAGRARFAAFPDLAADDLFVDQRFSSAERRRVDPGVTYTAPATTRALLARKTRAFAGNIQLGREGPPCHPDHHPTPRRRTRWYGVVARDPRLVRHTPAYLAITLVAKTRARLVGHRAIRRWGAR